jgi:hypothetical protein
MCNERVASFCASRGNFFGANVQRACSKIGASAYRSETSRHIPRRISRFSFANDFSQMGLQLHHDLQGQV